MNVHMHQKVKITLEIAAEISSVNGPLDVTCSYPVLRI